MAEGMLATLRGQALLLAVLICGSGLYARGQDAAAAGQGESCSAGMGIGCQAEVGHMEVHNLPHEATIDVFYSFSSDLWSECSSGSPQGGEADTGQQACSRAITIAGTRVSLDPSSSENDHLSFHLPSDFPPGTRTVSLHVSHPISGALVAEAHSTFEWKVDTMSPEEALERVLGALSSEASGHVSGSEKGYDHCAGTSHSCVQRFLWSGLECSLPRAAMRVFEIQRAVVRQGRLRLLVPRAWMRELEAEMSILNTRAWNSPEREAPVEVVDEAEGWREGGPHEATAWCGGSGRQGQGLLLVGLGLGTVEHFAHFVWDYVLNLERLTRAFHAGHEHSQRVPPEGNVTVLLQHTSMQTLLTDRPRKFYDLLPAVLGEGWGGWEALGEVPEGTCFRSVLVGIGAGDSAKAADVMAGVEIPHRSDCLGCLTSLLNRIRSHYGISGHLNSAGGGGGVTVLSRAGERWRRLGGEQELVARWNKEHGSKGGLEARIVEMHSMTMRQQVQLLWETRLLVTVNGAQASAMLFLSPGASALNIYAHKARWTDMAFGAMQRIALEMAGVRYLQVEVGEEHTIQADYEDEFRRLRDADVWLPYEEYEALLLDALGRGVCVHEPLSVEQALGEAGMLTARLNRNRHRQI